MICLERAKVRLCDLIEAEISHALEISDSIIASDMLFSLFYSQI
jgi:hypothetical protein